ncbi:MAG: TIR domain-containing protein [Pseudomonadota bacterium]
MPASSLHQELAILEQQAADFLQPDVAARIQQEARLAIDQHNRWCEEQRAVLEARQGSLAAQQAALQAERAELEREVQALEATQPDAHDGASVEAHNARVRGLNTRLAGHGARVAAFNAERQDADRAIEAYNEQIRASAERVEEARELAEDRLGIVERWFQQDGPEDLWRALRRLRAQAASERQENQDDASRGRLEKLREHVEGWFRARQQTSPHGLVLTPATLGAVDGGRAADAQMIVDTAASTVSLTREMVEILGIGEFVGEEVELNLPNAIRIRAPSVLVPSIEVQGHTAEWVKGIVLDEAIPGIEGSLGMSFLARFDYRIEGRTLSLGRRAPAATPRVHDVFICHKSQDRASARRVHDLLVERGAKPFFSPISVPELGDADFQRVIDQAIEGATHMVLVCSSRAAIETPWVASEWRSFVNMLCSGQKRGNLLNLLCDGMLPAQLPASLSRFHAVTLDAPGWRDELVRFVS